MTKKLNAPVPWFVQSYYKPYAATAILPEPIIDSSEDVMSTCKVVLYGLKPSEISYSTNENVSEIPLQRQRQHSFSSTTTTTTTTTMTNTSIHQAESRVSPETDYLNLHIKPLATPRSSRSTSSGDTAHESTPIRVMISENSRGRRRICVSQTLLRRHNGDV